MADIPEKIGRYRILDRVGKGAMGALFRGVDSVLEREVAVKLMLDFADDAEQMRPRFYQEARAIARLQHPNIVTVFEFAEEGTTPYIVMEFLRGSSLSSRMTEGVPLTLDEKLNIIAQLASALSYAHEQGIVHRDVKPANVFVLQDGSVKLLDFGVAKMMSSTLTQTGDILGSASYMSPEQVSGSDSVDGRSDVFSAGVVLYELIAGRKPFQAESPTAILLKILNADPPRVDEIVPGLPPALVAAIRKALAKNPADRFATAGDLARELQAIRRTLPAGGHAGEEVFDGTIVSGAADGQSLRQELAAATADSAAARPAQAPSLSAVSVPDVDAAPKGRGWLIPAAVAAIVILAAGGFLLFGRGGPGTGDADAGGREAAAVAADTAGGPSRTDATPAALVRVSMKVDSTPTGATIAIDGRETGQTTPAAVTVEGPGPHQLRVAKEGFVPQEASLTDAELQRGDVSYVLPPVEVPKIPVTITSAYPVRVLQGTQQVAAENSSHKLSIADGTTLRVSAPKVLLDASVKVSGTQVNYRTPALGYLTVRTSRETCSVRVGRQTLGYPPINRLAVVAGQHRVDMDCPDGQNPPGQMVTVTADSEAVVRIF